MALGACAYLLAYALFIARAGTRSRFLALVPCAAVALCWLGAYTPFDNVFRGPADPMRLGQIVQISGMQAQITRTAADGRPAEAAFRFAAPLNDPSLRWLKWEGGRYGEFVLPAVGDSCTLPGAPLFP